MERRWFVWLASLTCLSLIGYACMTLAPRGLARNSSRWFQGRMKVRESVLGEMHLQELPQVLYDTGLYNRSDFRNERGIIPSYWHQNKSCNGQGKECKTVWGPCYPPVDSVNWEQEINKWKTRGEDEADYHPLPQLRQFVGKEIDDYCRPGFLIVGQGKCGTSSLYHYLVGHPRVLPASEKQIHYFKVSY